jgi:hypothetical protein
MDVYEVQDSSRKEEGLTRSRDETSNGSPSYDTVGGRRKSCRSRSGGGRGSYLAAFEDGPVPLSWDALHKLPLPVSSSSMVARDVYCYESSASLPWISR